MRRRDPPWIRGSKEEREREGQALTLENKDTGGGRRKGAKGGGIGSAGKAAVRASEEMKQNNLRQ